MLVDEGYQFEWTGLTLLPQLDSRIQLSYPISIEADADIYAERVLIDDEFGVQDHGICIQELNLGRVCGLTPSGQRVVLSNKKFLDEFEAQIVRRIEEWWEP